MYVETVTEHSFRVHPRKEAQEVTRDSAAKSIRPFNSNNRLEQDICSQISPIPQLQTSDKRQYGLVWNAIGVCVLFFNSVDPYYLQTLQAISVYLVEDRLGFCRVECSEPPQYVARVKHVSVQRLNLFERFLPRLKNSLVLKTTDCTSCDLVNAFPVGTSEKSLLTNAWIGQASFCAFKTKRAKFPLTLASLPVVMSWG